MNEGIFCNCLFWLLSIQVPWVLFSASMEGRKIQSLARWYQHIFPTQGLAKRKQLQGQVGSTSLPTQGRLTDLSLVLPSGQEKLNMGWGWRGQQPRRTFLIGTKSRCGFHSPGKIAGTGRHRSKPACLSKAKPHMQG